jgi:hypothetical protein
MRLGAVAKAAVEFMQAAHVVKMAMGADRLQGAVAVLPHPVLQGAKSHSGVYHQIAVAPAHMPDVAAQEIRDPGFLD